MNFHYTSNNQMHVSSLEFGKSLGIIKATHTRAQYVTISKVEFEFTHMVESQMLQYMLDVKKCLDFGGQVFLEVTP